MKERKQYDINDYRVDAVRTAKYAHHDYPLVALSEEVGEVMGKAAKYARKQGVPVYMALMEAEKPFNTASSDLRDDLKKELGDVIWNWVNLCEVLNFDPADVMDSNIAKLTGREERGTIDGEGDDR